jgi:hypothetical protein
MLTAMRFQWLSHITVIPPLRTYIPSFNWNWSNQLRITRKCIEVFNAGNTTLIRAHRCLYPALGKSSSLPHTPLPTYKAISCRKSRYTSSGFPTNNLHQFFVTFSQLNGASIGTNSEVGMVTSLVLHVYGRLCQRLQFHTQNTSMHCTQSAAQAMYSVKCCDGQQILHWRKCGMKW